jgi:hypothetical protein
MATSDAYKRGKSGFSVKDEKDAAAYKEVNRKHSVEIMGERGSAVRTAADVPGSIGNAENSWKQNTKTQEGRGHNAGNMKAAEEALAQVQKKRIDRTKGIDMGDL